MKTDLSALIHKLMEALRQELQEYGEMLALLDQQQASVVARAAEEVAQSAVSINEQLRRLHGARQQREACQKEVGKGLAAADCSFAVLAPLLPEKFRAAVEILVRENNQLLLRIQQRTRQNHLLLNRSLQLMQQFMNALMPAGGPTTYNGEGQVKSGKTAPQVIYEAVG